MYKLNERSILKAGLFAGFLDISGALIVYVAILKITTVQRLLQSVAAGIFGKQSYSGGNTTAIAGLLFHFFIAMMFSLAYHLIYPAFNKIIKNTFLKGFIYGCIVWSIMNLVVVPLSAINRPFTFSWQPFLYGIGLIIFCVGMPIAYAKMYNE